MALLVKAEGIEIIIGGDEPDPSAAGALRSVFYVLRWYLWRASVMPWRYMAFLDYAAERILLRKVGGDL